MNAKPKKLAAALVITAALAGGGYAAWRSAQDGDGTEDRLVLYGNVDIRQVELAFRVSGRIADLRLEEGEPAAKGELMAALDPEPYQHDLRLAEGERAARRATLDKLVSGYRPEEIAQAEAVVAERQAVLRNAERTLERRQALVRSDDVSKQAFDDALATREEAEARLASAEKALALLRAGYRAEDIAAARGDFDAAEAKVARAETALADTRLNAPADGIIFTRIREDGAVVAAGDPVYTLSVTSPVWVRAYVSEPDLGRIRPGMAASVSTDMNPGTAYAAHIGYISPRAEFTPKSVETPDLRTSLVYRLRLVVDDPRTHLRQGMPVTVTIALSPAAGVGTRDPDATRGQLPDSSGHRPVQQHEDDRSDGAR